MGKIRYKKDVKWIDGRVIDPATGDVVAIPMNAAIQAEKLDLMAQQYDYLRAQEPGRPAPSLAGFVRRSVVGHGRPYMEEPDTPVTDARVAEAMAFMKEADDIKACADVNHAIDELGELFDFLGSDHWFEPPTFRKEVVDTPVLGNILELTPEDARAIIEEIAKSPIVLLGEEG